VAQDTSQILLRAITLCPVAVVLGFAIAFIWIRVHAALQPRTQTA
jgi:hypothetical protein